MPSILDALATSNLGKTRLFYWLTMCQRFALSRRTTIKRHNPFVHRLCTATLHTSVNEQANLLCNA
jgi:hypothetical protein